MSMSTSSYHSRIISSNSCIVNTDVYFDAVVDCIILLCNFPFYPSLCPQSAKILLSCVVFFTVSSTEERLVILMSGILGLSV